MNVLNNAAVAGATAELTRLENWQLIRGHLVGTVPGHPDLADGETIHTSDVLTVVKHRRVCTPQSRVRIGNARSRLGATASTDALQSRRSARNRCTSQFDTGPRWAQTLISCLH